MTINNDLKEFLDILYDMQELNNKYRNKAFEIIKHDEDKKILSKLYKEEDT